MNKIILFSVILIAFSANKTIAQKQTPASEKYGTTLNLGLGIGYYSYVSSSSPVIHADLELDVTKNFTLAPFITYFSYKNYNYWGNSKYAYRNYYYTQTVIPIGVKGTYYFDQLLGAGSKWDFYLAGSLGYVYRKTTWDNDYYGDRYVEHGTSGLYLDGHIGTEFHINKKLGLFLDLSSGISTFGLAVHL